MSEKEPPADPNKIVAMPLDRARRARGENVIAMPRSKVASLRAFRRVRADRLFGAIGLALVVVGVALMFVWEKPPEVPKTFSIEWEPATHHVTTESFSLTSPQTPKVFTLNVPGPNVTAVAFYFAWKDDIGNEGTEADNFSMELKGPPGSNLTLPPMTFQVLELNVTRAYLMSGVPDIASVSASSEQQARAAVGDRTNRTGTGTYEITFRLIRLNGDWSDNSLRDQAPCSPPYCTPDTKLDIRFHFEYTTYNIAYKKNF